MTQQSIILNFTSRFKNTPIYSQDGSVFFGLWSPPNIVLDGNEKVIKVTPDVANDLNLIAYREYNDASLFWAIAQVNKIHNISEEVVVGKELIIPKIQTIRVALQSEEH